MEQVAIGKPILRTTKISRAIQGIAAAHRLGKFQDSYPPKRRSSLYLLSGSLMLLIGGLIILFFVLFYDAIFQQWPPWLAAVVPLIGMGWIGIGVWIVLTPLLYPELSVFVYTNGMICRRRKAEVIRWKQLGKLWKKVQTNAEGKLEHSYATRCSSGSTYIFNDDLSNIEQLGARLEREIVRLHFPATLASYEKGVPQLFGELRISWQGIGLRDGQKMLPWSEVENITIDEKHIHVYRKNDLWEKTPLMVKDVPDVVVLSELLKHIKQEQEREQLPSIAAYLVGTRISFGAMSISRQGLELHTYRKQLPWSDVGSIGIGENEIIVRSNEREWYALPLWMMDDLDELRELLMYIFRSQQR